MGNRDERERERQRKRGKEGEGERRERERERNRRDGDAVRTVGGRQCVRNITKSVKAKKKK